MSEPMLQILYAGAIGLVLIGMGGVVFAPHLFRKIIALAIAEAGANLLLVLAGYRDGGIAPILGFGPADARMTDPVPQAMVLTAIVIGVGVQALALAVAVRIREAYATLDMATVRLRMEAEVDRAAGLAPDAPSEAPATPSTPAGEPLEVPR